MWKRQSQIEDKLGLRRYFGGKTPPAPAVPKPPAPSGAATNASAQQQAAAKRKGTASTFLSGAGGVQDQTSKKTFLGG